MSRNENTRLVYLVDDDEAFRDSLAWLLEAAGWRTAAYATGEAFLDGWTSGAATCLVLDVRLPGMSGLEVQQALRDAGHALPVIVITGHGDAATEAEAMRRGALCVLQKPFKDKQLLALLEQVAARDAAPVLGRPD